MHPADRVPALVVTAGVALAIAPFVIALARPATIALAVGSLALRSLAPVHQHCHAHYAVFGRRALDAIYDVILLLAAGNTTAVWELQHVQGHHRAYLGRTHDPANHDRFGGGRLGFAILGDAISAVDAWRLARGPSRARLVRQLALQLAIVVAAFAVDPVAAVIFLVIPWLLLRWFVFWFSWAQHHDVPMHDVYSGSVTHFGWTNRLYLNVGHHTAHHEKPTLHWTRLPARTAQILERIPSSCLR
ncbi:MAG TPA: fatty acid desaturase [Kofleriaceae bacterium]|nr:fatty acid desaturase [Kofleriaceae bacterium]